MSERNETPEDALDPMDQEQPTDVLTGEDVVLDEVEFDNNFTGVPSDAEAPTLDAAPPAMPLAEPPAEPPVDIPTEPLVIETPTEKQPAEPQPLTPDYPETTRVDTASADDLADSISSLDTDFSAPMREDIPTEPRDVLQGRSAQPVVGSDGQTLVTAPEAAEEALPSSPADVVADEVVDTTVMRRSLVNHPDPEPAYPEPLPLEPAPVSFASPTSSSDSHVDAALLDGATVLPTVPSRAGARWLSAIGTLLLAPVAWYLLTDSAVRLAFATDSPWSTGQINLAALGEMLGGLVVLLIIALLAMRSSLGLFLTGLVVTVLGLPFLVVPGMTSSFLKDHLSDPLSRLGAFGQNIYFHVTATGSTGLLVIVGIALLLSSFVVFRLRRIGRGEESLRSEVAAVNPEGLHARWARKATDRA